MMSSTATTDESDDLPETDGELVCEISCMCGWTTVVDEADGGQTHGGTAGLAGATHSCAYERGELHVPKGQSPMRFNWVFR